MKIYSQPQQIFAIGDVHGCADELSDLISRLPLGANSWVVFLGDYIDRGPNSRKVIDTILHLRNLYRVVTLRGNHEQMLLDFLSRPQSEEGGMFILNGGASTLVNYANENGEYFLPENHLEFFRTLDLYFETPNYFFVHAGVPDVPLENIFDKHQDELLMWIRSPFLKSKFDWGKPVVHGHTPSLEPELKSNRINVDTGCVFGGKLTAVELPSQKFYSVSKKSEHNEVTSPQLRDSRSQRVSLRFQGRVRVLLNPKEKPIEMYTANYSEFGILMIDPKTPPQSPHLLSVNENIQGVLGDLSHNCVSFEGTIVRAGILGSEHSYGVKFNTLKGQDRPATHV